MGHMEFRVASSIRVASGFRKGECFHRRVERQVVRHEPHIDVVAALITRRRDRRPRAPVPDGGREHFFECRIEGLYDSRCRVGSCENDGRVGVLDCVDGDAYPLVDFRARLYSPPCSESVLARPRCACLTVPEDGCSCIAVA